MNQRQDPLALPANRFAFIHSLRGIAALIVVWSHLSGFWLQSNDETALIQNIWHEWIVIPFHMFQNGGHLGVLIFFLISGYIITHTSLRESRLSFTIKRTLRIFPPLIFAIIITWILFRFAAMMNMEIIGVIGGGFKHWIASAFLIEGFLPGHPRALIVTWTLVVELLYYICAFILLGYTKKRPLMASWCLTGIWVLLFVSTLNFDYLGANSQLTIYLGFLILGQVIYLAHQSLIKLFDAVILGTTLMFLYILFFEAMQPGFMLTPGGWSGVEPIVSYVFALLIFLAMMRLAPKKVVQPFNMLGNISYSLYLLHIPVGATLLNLLSQTEIPTSISIIVAILVSIAASWVAFKLIEVPFQKFARIILKKFSTRPTKMILTQ